MNEKRFELSEYSTVYRYSVIDNIQKGTLKANEIIILLSKQAEKIDEQQATLIKQEQKIKHLREVLTEIYVMSVQESIISEERSENDE